MTTMVVRKQAPHTVPLAAPVPRSPPTDVEEEQEEKEEEAR